MLCNNIKVYPIVRGTNFKFDRQRCGELGHQGFLAASRFLKIFPFKPFS